MTISVTGVGAGSNASVSSSATPCSKLAICAYAYQLSTVTVTARDAYGPTLRALLGLPSVSSMSFAYSLGLATGGGGSAIAMALVSNGTGVDSGASWVATIPQPQLGFWLLTVFADGITIDSAPTVVVGLSPVCSGSKIAQPDGSCAWCVSVTASQSPTFNLIRCPLPLSSFCLATPLFPDISRAIAAHPRL